MGYNANRAEHRLPHFRRFEIDNHMYMTKDCYYNVKPCLVLLTIYVLNAFSFGVYCRGYYVEVLKCTALHKVPNSATLVMVVLYIIYREYYTVARRYEFYVRVARTISHE